MDKPILYYDEVSPPVRSVLMLINALNIDVDLKFIDLFIRGNLNKNFLLINPTRTVPVLKHNDLILTDSHAILMYLCDKFAPNHELFPQEIILRSKIINRLMFNATVLFRHNSDYMKTVFTVKIIDQTEHIKNIKETYDFMEEYLSQSKYISCDHMTIADISNFATLSSLHFFVLVSKDTWPLLNNWLETMKQHSMHQAANQPGIIKLIEMRKKFVKR